MLSKPESSPEFEDGLEPWAVNFLSTCCSVKRRAGERRQSADLQRGVCQHNSTPKPTARARKPQPANAGLKSGVGRRWLDKHVGRPLVFPVVRGHPVLSTEPTPPFAVGDAPGDCC